MTKPSLMGGTPNNPDANALIEAHESIIGNPEPRRLAIIEINTDEIRRPVHGGDEKAIMTIEYIELVPLDSKAYRDVEKIANTLFAGRTGKKVRDTVQATPDTPLDLDGLPDGVEEPGARVTPLTAKGGE